MIYFMPSPLQFLSHFIIIIIYEAYIIIYVLLIKWYESDLAMATLTREKIHEMLPEAHEDVAASQ